MASTSTPLNPNLESILRENRVFPPPPEFAAKAQVKSLEEYEALYKQSIEDPEAFWGGVAKELHWFAPWTKVLEWNLPWAKWFVGGKINSATTASTAMPSAKGRTRSQSFGRANPAKSASSPSPNCIVEVQKFANVLKASA